MKAQNNAIAEFFQSQSSKLAGFLAEALFYVDATTPTFINEGGCGIFAKLLHNKLKEFGVDAKILACYKDESDTCLHHLRNYISNGTDLAEAGEDHIILQVGDLFLDSDGIVNSKALLYTVKIELTEAQLDALIEKGSWNPVFDRECVPFIQSKLDEVFEKATSYEPGIFGRIRKVELTPHTKEMKSKYMINRLFHSILG